jgi:hypothetical protein
MLPHVDTDPCHALRFHQGIALQGPCLLPQGNTSLSLVLFTHFRELIPD